MGRRIALALILAATVALYATATSTATPKIGFQLKAKGGKSAETVGAAKARGRIRIEYKPSRRKYRLVLHGKVDDVCPKDGFGAVLEMRAYVSDPDATLSYYSKQVSDARKCPPDPRRVAMATSWIRISENPIYKVELHLYEYDADRGDIAFDDDAFVEYSPSQLGI